MPARYAGRADPRGADPSVGRADAGAGGPADAGADGRARPPAQADAPARARVRSAGPRRELDVSARSYRAGLERIRPRADRFAAAVRATLAAGASAAEVQAILAEAGLSLAELPAALADEIDAAGEPRPGPDV